METVEPESITESSVADVCPSTAANGSFPDGWNQSAGIVQET